MSILLRQNTAVTLRLGPFVDSVDGDTEETALTILNTDIRLSKNGAAFGAKTDVSGGTHDEHAWYSTSLDTTDTNTPGLLELSCHITGARFVTKTFLVIPANVYDSLVLGTDKLQVDTNEMTGLAYANLTAFIQTKSDDTKAILSGLILNIRNILRR